MKKKIIILSSVVLALIIVSGGYLLYILQFKKYDVADTVADKIIEDPFNISLPNGTKLIIDDSDSSGFKIRKEYPNRKGEKPEDEQTENELTSSTIDSSTIKYTDRVTVAEIKKKYKPVIKDFNNQLNLKTETLITHINNEYSTKNESNEKVSYAYMYNKYREIVKSFETKSNTMFNGIMESLEVGLESNGYNKGYSNSFRVEYDELKKIRRDKILNNAIKQ